MTGPEIFVLVIDLLGTFAFALNGSLTAAKIVRLDIVGVVVLGLITAVGGGIVRDVLLGDIPRLRLRTGITSRWRLRVR
ncbi:trimeric intracellular cation channel family protein [Gulosibacter molinativorax]|uniref:trimeric intracellular cation channel family protein n=1 Tax=Gulosibacter molinativorax TaxID=256821 RepID=UPI00223FDF49|nr:TRIC cation channel family protein [Gulosibacter molinativorax]QUY61002.1 Membrane protein [Gulosibacter molinativorax]